MRSHAYFAIALGLGKPAPVQLACCISLFPLFLQLDTQPLGFRPIMQDRSNNILNLQLQEHTYVSVVQRKSLDNA